MLSSWFLYSTRFPSKYPLLLRACSRERAALVLTDSFHCLFLSLTSNGQDPSLSPRHSDFTWDINGGLCCVGTCLSLAAVMMLCPTTEQAIYRHLPACVPRHLQISKKQDMCANLFWSQSARGRVIMETFYFILHVVPEATKNKLQTNACLFSLLALSLSRVNTTGTILQVLARVLCFQRMWCDSDNSLVSGWCSSRAVCKCGPRS